MADLKTLLETAQPDPGAIAQRARRIHQATLSRSRHLDGPNFTWIHPHDLSTLFDEIDKESFGGSVRMRLGTTPLTFRLSRRMSQRAGTTTRFPQGYTIKISTEILFRNFTREDHRPIAACGLPCSDRLEALQRVMEHELVHLIEMLLWVDSSCKEGRFQEIAWRFFGHTDHRHALITPREQAIATSGILPGNRVRFLFEGVPLTGFVNRVTKRATVLVADPQGEPYSDGGRYRRFYVPLTLLEVLPAEDHTGRNA